MILFMGEPLWPAQSKSGCLKGSEPSLTSFIACVKFSLDPLFGFRPKTKFSDTNIYGTYPIWMLGFLSMAFALVFLDCALML